MHRGLRRVNSETAILDDSAGSLANYKLIEFKGNSSPCTWPVSIPDNIISARNGGSVQIQNGASTAFKDFRIELYCHFNSNSNAYSRQRK